jgi:glycosyltransferase involved in cell wall biosynthesis
VSEPSLTVAICTYNPRWEFLLRAIEALRIQTLSPDAWDLIVIDNASPQPIQPSSLSWNSRLRVIREPRLGLTPARLAAIAAATTDLIVFVDDDNLLFPDYLEQARKIAVDFPLLGAWGGQCFGDFVDCEPEQWTRSYWPLLAINTLDRDWWANQLTDFRFIPCGAGLVVRKLVADAYSEKTRNSSIRLSLDRRGNDLASCGDSDLALTACDLGHGVGRFVRLKLKHIIPRERLTEAYLARLTESMACSSKVLLWLRGAIQPEPSGLAFRIRRAIRSLRAMRSRDARRRWQLQIAGDRGRARADALIRFFQHAR